MLLIQGVRDKIVNVADVDRLVQTYTDGGAAVSYHRDPVAEHLLLYPFGVPMSLWWLADRLAKKDRPASRHTWPALLDSRTYVGLPALAAAASLAVASRVAPPRRRGRTDS